MTDPAVKLTEDLFDARDPKRPRVFLHPKGATVAQSLADRFGGQYEGKKPAKAAAEPKPPADPAPTPTKKRTPATKKATPATKKVVAAKRPS